MQAEVCWSRGPTCAAWPELEPRPAVVGVELEVGSREKRGRTPSVGKKVGRRLFPVQISVTASL